MDAAGKKGPDVPHPLRGLAWLNVVLHVVAVALAGLGMRPGSPLVPLGERLAYLAGAPVGWTLGWVAFMGCAAALVAFLAAVAYRPGGPAPLAQLGLTVAVVGAGFDLGCDSLYVLVFPALAAARPPDEALFLLVERATGIVSLAIANGAYSVGILLVTLSLRGRPGVGPVTTVVGLAVAGFGLLLAAVGFTGVPWHAEWATPPTLGLYCLWVVLVARSLEPGGRRL